MIPSIGQQIKSRRLAQSITLADLSETSGMSEATLSRIENGRSEISAQNLYKVAATLGVDIGAFFSTDPAPLNTGLRSFTQQGTAPSFATPAFVSEVLCADVTAKAMQPFVNTITARSLEETEGCQSHAGEEFLLVLEGELLLYSSLYAPLLMGPGDALYFSGAMAHAYVNASSIPARILVVTTDTDGPHAHSPQSTHKIRT